MKNTLFLLLTILTISCASRKDIIYVQGLSDSLIVNSKYKAPVLKIDDRITINISSPNPLLAAPYNLFVTTSSKNSKGATIAGQQQQQSYLINKKGYISFPELGDVKVAGLTRTELKNKLEKELTPFLTDKVIATVELINFRITVLGEVNDPGEYIIDRDKISLLQAIGLAGDLTIHGVRDNVLLIRENQNEIETYGIDLTSKEILNSDYFYLQQNDVIYIKPNKPKVNASTSSPTASYIISATGLLITIISILI